MLRAVASVVALLGLLVAGCSAPPACEGAPEGIDAGALDARAREDSGDVADAAPADASVSDGCNPLLPLRIDIATAYAALGPSSTRACAYWGRIRLYRHADHALVWDSASLPVVATECPNVTLDGLGPGDYDLTIVSDTDPQWLLGGDIERPEHCVQGGAFCAPLRVVLAPCESRAVMVVLSCDAAAGACPPAAWPWLEPAP